MSVDRSFWRWFAVSVAAVCLNTVFLFTDHIGRPLEILRNYLMIPGVMLALAVSSPNEADGRGWGVLARAAIFNWFLYSVILFVVVFAVRRWNRKTRTINPSK